MTSASVDKPTLPLLSVLAVVFLLTGFTGLVVEQVFEKLLTTVVGASTTAGAIVLAVYFGGLSLGGLLYGPVRSKVINPLRIYGLLEGAVGLYALGLYAFWSRVQEISAGVVDLGGDSDAATFLLRLVVAAIWILPPTIAMGATFPAVVGVLRESLVADSGRHMARFYALNLGGAVGGAAAGGFVLFPVLGLDGTLLTLALLQTAVAVVLLRLSRSHRPAESPSPAGSSAERAAGGVKPLLSRGGLRVVLALGFLSGLVVFGMEVVWIHLIGAVIGMSIYAFALMLAIVLLGLFCGGLIAERIAAERDTLPVWSLAAAYAGAVVTLGVTGALWDDVPVWLLERGRGVEGFLLGEWVRASCAMVVIGPPSVALGVVYPLLFRLPWFPADDRDRAAGVVGAANALGSVTGALVVGFVLVPKLGSEGTYHLFVLTLALVGLGVAAAALARGPRRDRRPALALLVALLVATAVDLGQDPWDRKTLVSGVNVYFRVGHVRPSSEIMFWHEDTAGGITTVIRDQASFGEVRTLLTNGKFQGTDAGEVPAQISFASIPLSQRPARGRALVIGLGTGMSAATVAAAGFEHTDIAELSPGIVAAARTWFDHVNLDVLDRPSVSLHVEDGRNHLLRGDEPYDVISMEISSVWFAGASSLYAQEFYELASERLEEGGVLQQWLQLHHLGTEEVLSTIATLRSVFPYVRVWWVGGQAILCASDRPLSTSEEALQDLQTSESMKPLRAMLAAKDLDLRTITQRVVLESEDVDRLYEDAVERRQIPLNTDRNRYLEYQSPRYNLSRVDWVGVNLSTLLEYVPEAQRDARAAGLGLVKAP